jgi:proteasome alpha subunit
MQTLTQYGGIRPYGTALLIAGVSDGESRLFETDPSGTLLEYKATGIGIGRPAAMKVFEEEYNPESEIKDAILLGLKALHSATEGKFDVDTVEIGVIERETATFRKMTKDEVASFVEQFKQ